MAPLTHFKLTPEVEDLICQAIRLGSFDYVAAECAGISVRTFSRWIRAGEEAESKLDELFGMKVGDLRKRCRDLRIDETGKKDDLVRRLGSSYIRLERFYEKVRQAKAIARAEAESQVKQSKPEVWLTKGPGRERPGAPGWTESREGPTSIEINVEVDTKEKSEEERITQGAALLRHLKEFGAFENVVPIRTEDPAEEPKRKAVPKKQANPRADAREDYRP